MSAADRLGWGLVAGMCLAFPEAAAGLIILGGLISLALDPPKRVLVTPPPVEQAPDGDTTLGGVLS